MYLDRHILFAYFVIWATILYRLANGSKINYIKFMQNQAASSTTLNPPAVDLTFKRMASIGTAVGFAAALGTMACLERSAGHGLALQWHWRAVLWMALGAVAAVHLWNLVWRAQAGDTPEAKQRLKRFCIVLLASALVVFVYPIAFVSSEHFNDVLTGLSLATAVLTFVGWMIYRVARGFAENDAANG
jgi:hypothetical protein